MTRKLIAITFLASLCLTLSACGIKGDLYLPERTHTGATSQQAS